MAAAPIFAAVAGALIRDSFGTKQSWFKASVRGLGAGVVSVLLFVSAQLLLDPDALLSTSALFRLSFFLVPVGFTTGFTFDLVFDRLRHAEALRLTEIATPLQEGLPQRSAPRECPGRARGVGNLDDADGARALLERLIPFAQV